MVHGHCRVIPVIKEMVELPAEVKGILYADFTKSLTLGMKSVLTALEHDRNRRNVELGFWAQAAAVIAKVFGPTGFASASSEFESWNWEFLSVEGQDVILNVVSAYGTPAKPLGDSWWSEYTDYIYDKHDHEHLFLLVTERPIGIQMDQQHPQTNRVTVKFLGHSASPRSYIVGVDLTQIDDETTRRELLAKARELLSEFAQRVKRHPE
jgi:hypothetical protein